MAVSILLSAFLALTLTLPFALRYFGLISLTGVKAAGFPHGFNARFDRLASFYASGLGFVLKRTDA